MPPLGSLHCIFLFPLEAFSLQIMASQHKMLFNNIRDSIRIMMKITHNEADAHHFKGQDFEEKSNRLLF